MLRHQRIALAMAGYAVKPPSLAQLLRWVKHNRPSILVTSPRGIPCA